MSRRGKQLVFFLETTGTKLEPHENMPIGTYYAEFVGDSQPNVSCHLKYDGTVVATATFESSNDPDATIYVTATAGSWVDESSITDLAIAASAGGQMMQHSGWTAARGRVKVVCTTAGRLYGWRGL